MKLFVKTAIVSLAMAGMVHADTILLGVDAGVTIGGARLGVVVGLTGGHARDYTAPGHHAHGHVGHSCGTIVATTVSNPCDYVCGPCEVIAPPCPPVVSNCCNK